MVVLGCIMLLALNLPHTCGGETALGEHCETLKEVDSNMQQVKAAVLDYVGGGGNRCSGGGCAASRAACWGGNTIEQKYWPDTLEL